MSSLIELLDGRGDDVIVYRDGSATTRAELDVAARELADTLVARGVAGRAVGVSMANIANTVAAWFGIWRAGAAFVPLNPRSPAAERARVVERTGVVAVVTSGAGGAPFAVEPCSPARERVIDAGDAIVQFTSGTTGQPKAVVLRHDTVSELLDSVIGSLRAGRSDTKAQMPNIVPMSLSLWAGIYQVLFACKLGVPVVLMEQFEPREFARLIAEYAIRSSVLPPAALVMLMQDPAIESLEPLRYVRSVSAPLSPAQARRFHERFGIAVLNGYGQTELGGEAVGWTGADWKEHGQRKLGSVGRPHAAFQLRVRNADGALATPDEVGELEILSSSALPSGEAEMEGRVTPDGWLRTGDLARIDDEGFVWIEGRVSAMINRGGLKVFPDEVEELLRGHPTVEDAAVVGVPDERLGEVPWAFVVARPGADVDPDELRTWCRDHMAPYKIPAGISVVVALPRNEMGKVLRNELVVGVSRDSS